MIHNIRQQITEILAVASLVGRWNWSVKKGIEIFNLPKINKISKQLESKQIETSFALVFLLV